MTPNGQASWLLAFFYFSYPEYHRLLPCPSQNCPPRVEHLVVSEGGPVLEYICRELNLPPLWVLLCLKFIGFWLMVQVTYVVFPKLSDFNENGVIYIHHFILWRFVADLIHFGAVYYALVCPKPPLTATPEQMRVFKEVTDPSVLSKRASIKGKTVREAQKTFRITHVDQIVEAGTYLRVHVHPKRFPRWNTSVDWCLLWFLTSNIKYLRILFRCYDIDWNSRIIAVTESHVVLDKPAGTSVCNSSIKISFSLFADFSM